MFAMANGKVDFFNDTGGYGFIETEDADEASTWRTLATPTSKKARR